jgi:hypothetical protein
MSILNVNFFSFLHTNLLPIRGGFPCATPVRRHGARFAVGAADDDYESPLALPTIEVILLVP